jgi:TRAP-type C4-dicarboxylate transport system permease small subunit
VRDRAAASLAAIRGPLRPYARLLLALDTAAGWTIVALISAMVTVVAVQVFLRYVTNTSLGWADELSRLTFVWSIFLAIPLGIRAGVHIGMEIVTSRLPPRVRDALARLMAAIAAALMVLVAWQAAVVAFDQWDEKMASLEASAAWFLVAVAIGCAHSALHLVMIVAHGKPEVAMAVATE